MTDFKTIPLKDIHPDPNQPRRLFDDLGMRELTESIKEQGVLQPIIVRTNGNGWRLVAGERRLRAALAAGLPEIPAMIRQLTDEEAFEVQITENLQRKDIHPMEEASAFQALLKKHADYSIKELVTRFAKSAIYVTQRLSFNNLIPEFQKEFYEGRFLTGHAVLLSRLTKDDQYLLRKNIGKDDFGSVADLNDEIDNHITNLLSKASFKMDDANLYPAAGACTNCPKRSGGNHLLFPDVKDKDRCFDKKCYDRKTELDFTFRLKDIIETRPEILLIQSEHRDSNKTAVALAKTMNVKVLKEGTDFQGYDYGGYKKKAQGFWINGWDQGRIKTIYLKGTAAIDKNGKKSSAPEKPAKEQIADIQKREARNKELDLEKIHKATLEVLEKLPSMKLANTELTQADRGIMIYMLLHAGDYRFNDQLGKLMKLPKSTSKRHSYDEEYIIALAKIPDSQLALIIRQLAWNQYGNKNQVSGIGPEDSCLRMIAGNLGVNLKKVEGVQEAIATKRQDRVKKRLADLRSDKKKAKDIPTPPPPPAKTKKKKS
jgi:ParB/RepB/Spo0J family partition protein